MLDTKKIAALNFKREIRDCCIYLTITIIKSSIYENIQGKPRLKNHGLWIYNVIVFEKDRGFRPDSFSLCPCFWCSTYPTWEAWYAAHRRERNRRPARRVPWGWWLSPRLLLLRTQHQAIAFFPRTRRGFRGFDRRASAPALQI